MTIFLCCVKKIQNFFKHLWTPKANTFLFTVTPQHEFLLFS